jgi:hypothetical protein
MKGAEQVSLRLSRGQTHAARTAGIADSTECALVGGARPQFEERGEGDRGSDNYSLTSSQEGGLHGVYVMAIFLVCGFLMTFGWGGITVF